MVGGSEDFAVGAPALLGDHALVPRMRLLKLLAPLLAAPLAVVLTLCNGHDPVASAAQAPMIHREGGFAGAAECRACHPDHFASWRRTFHASMTQLPTPEVVRGRFDGVAVACSSGVVTPMVRDGKFVMEVREAGGPPRQAEVVLAVGSRRYQQYFERKPRRDGDVIVRLPILWHIEARRWLPLETVFLEPDGAALEAHAATWNETCIFCHNTAPEPRLTNLRDPSRTPETASFQSRVAELGIACESCHGPAADHAASRRDPIARLRERSGRDVAHPAVNPSRLEQERAVAICGQCHGARLPQPLRRIADWLSTGPTYRSGDRLRDHVTPIEASTPVVGNADPELFALRFWGDGTPRLTAYEYQGITQSACYRKGTMTCASCHTMHGGDARGQLRPDLPGNAMCTQCHAAIGRELTAHTHHAADSAGSSCVECHMPKIVYGITTVHRSHRIDAPSASSDAASGRPHACTLCHVDRSLIWAGAEAKTMWGGKHTAPGQRRDRAPIELPDAIASLHAGDAAARAVYAAAIGREQATFAPAAAVPLRAHLAVAMGDGYPMVRWLAQQSLAALEQRRPVGLGAMLQGVDHTAKPEARAQGVRALLDFLAEHAPQTLPPPAPGMLLGGDCRLELKAVIRLTDLQSRNLISIGE